MKQYHITKEELNKYLEDFKNRNHSDKQSDFERFKSIYSDHDILESMDINIIETYLRLKKIKKIRNE